MTTCELRLGQIGVLRQETSAYSAKCSLIYVVLILISRDCVPWNNFDRGGNWPEIPHKRE